MKLNLSAKFEPNRWFEYYHLLPGHALKKLYYRILTHLCLLFVFREALNFPGAKKRIHKTDRFHGNGPYCKIPTKN